MKKEKLEVSFLLTKEKIIEMLTKSIARKKELLEQNFNHEEQTVDNNAQNRNLYFNNINNINDIIDADFQTIKELILSFSMSEVEKEKLIEEIKLIVQLLKINKENGTTLKLTDTQNKAVKKLLLNLNNFKSDRKDYSSIEKIELEKLSKDIKKYEKILKSLNKEKNIVFISDIDIFRELFTENSLTEKEKNKMYQFILKYNKKIYDYKIGNCNIKLLESMGKIDIAKLKKMFKGFGYSFDKMSMDMQSEIINRATFSNIREVLESLAENGYKLNVESNAYLLTSLLTKSDKTTIDRISKLAFSKGLTPEQVLKIGSILIRQSNFMKDTCLSKRFNIVDIDDNCLMIVGSSTTFEKNIKELAKWGLSVRNVYERCKYVLVCDNKILSHNLVLFQEYGFSLNNKNKKITSATLSALTQYNTQEIIDRFIEVHPLGLEYLRKNLSILKQIKHSDDLLFYRLYYSNKNYGGEDAFIKIISNNASLLCLQGKVSGLSTIYNDSYANINEENKLEITGTFIPTYSRDYYSIIKDKMNREIDASIFDNKYIQHVNSYSDKEEPLLYNFNGIRISKLKVLRIFDILLENFSIVDDEAFLFALLYNTIIDREDFYKLKKLLGLKV